MSTDLVPVEAHLAEILAATRPLTPVRLGLEEAEGGVLAEDAAALRSLPSFDNSGMDGYAVHAADVAAAAPGAPVTLPVAGFVSGITGTATSIGGPPLAILYQHHEPRVLRPTLAAYFVAGAAFSLVGLGIAGELDTDHTLLALALSPVLVLGLAVSVPVRRRLPRDVIRAGVLVVCSGSALVLVVRSLV